VKAAFKISSEIKSFLKQIIRKFLSVFEIRIIFKGERNTQYLREFLIEYYLLQSKGILHIGAHAAEERKYYDSIGKSVIWIEGDPVSFKELEMNIRDFPLQTAYCVMLSSLNQIQTFYVTSNNGFSSSLHPILDGVHDWGVKTISEKKPLTSRLDDIPIANLDRHDFWVVDVQGHEYQVLEGAQASIENAKWILVEVGTKEYYKDQKLFNEVDNLLHNFGFVKLYDPPASHCEILYKRA
jgi:FkbM family methyltransferase